ncbi:hypothetical protein GQ44DRAFT_766854 [Phaeosphaeriaceae sp. PMI808]|nr:hypothetical protein GQ44DRAFT_766854 [Phaeosphaeriaceae sp. PMI808]
MSSDMDSLALPQINTDAGVTSHAHPLPSPEQHSAYREDGLQNLISKVPLDIKLYGLINDDLPSATGFVFPRVRRSSITSDAVQHLDIISCWKGLSHSQGLELTTWEYLFKESLASQIEEYLQREFINDLSKYTNPKDEVLLVLRIAKYLSSGQTHLLNVSMTRLVYDMISHLYTSYCSDNVYEHFRWSLSSGDLPAFVYNFICLQDCFLHARGGPHLFFDLSHSYSEGVLAVSANVAWQLPRITFSSLPTQVSDGDIYRIMPQFINSSLITSWNNDYHFYEDTVAYSVLSSPLLLKWDNKHECFQGHVLYKPQGQDQVAETIMCANITTSFPSDVRFERISRYSIKLEVGAGTESRSDLSSHTLVHNPVYRRLSNEDKIVSLDPFSKILFGPTHSTNGHSSLKVQTPWIPSYTNTPLSKVGGLASCNRLSIKKKRRDRRDSFKLLPTELPSPQKKRLTPGKQCDSSSPCIYEFEDFSSGTEHSSSGKRKAPHSVAWSNNFHGRFALDKFEHPDLEVDVKRRKFQQGDETDANKKIEEEQSVWQDGGDDILYAHLDNFTTGPMGEAQSSPALESPCWFKKLDDTRARSAPRPYVATFPGMKQTKFPWRTRGDCVARSSSDTSSCAVDEITPPVSADGTASTSNDTPSQEQIQQNYEEFENRKRLRATEKAFYTATIPGFDGVVSPTDEDGKTFESIFLEDNEAED